jgi:translation elongation factor EF-G
MSDLISVAIIGKSAEKLASDLGVANSPLEGADVALFIVSAIDGIVRADIDSWNTARELYIPSIVVISDTDNADLDFDDMTAIASKMLDPVATRFLVLHADNGDPVALIDVVTLKIIDYSSGAAVVRESEDEHKDLIGDYVSEYLDRVEEAGDEGFIQGLLFPALPWTSLSRMGLDQIKELLNEIPAIS